MDYRARSVRGQAMSIAYRMLGSVPDAEDVAQEVALRFHQLDEEPQEPAA